MPLYLSIVSNSLKEFFFLHVVNKGLMSITDSSLLSSYINNGNEIEVSKVKKYEMSEIPRVSCNTL